MFLLDKNTVSHALKGNLRVQRHLQRADPNSLFVSSIVEAELRYGIIKAGLANTKLGGLVTTFLAKVDVLPWTKVTARHFAELRADSEKKGLTVDMVDLMIATHAREDKNLTLVTNDGALLKLKLWIKVADWTA